MPSRPRSVMIIALLSLAILACSLGGGEKETETTTPVAATSESTPIATKAPETTPKITITLGEVYRSDAGGFAFRVIPGYEIADFGDMVNMVAPGADPDLGPIVTLSGAIMVTDKTNEELYAELKDGTPLTLGPAQPITVNGIDGLAVDISGNNGGHSIRGRAALVMVAPRQQFALLLGAPADEWDAVAPYFDALLGSLEFFEPVIPPPTSTLRPGWYPYTNPNDARDVLLYDGVVYAATLGGVVIWEVSPALEEGFPTVFTPLDGLSHVSAHALTVCDVPVAGGGLATRIVAGTQLGLNFYDPMTGVWDDTPITPPEAGLETSKVDRLTCDATNKRLLIGYSGLGVLDLETGAWTRFTDKEGLSWNGISDIAVSGSDIWVASGYNGISKISGNQVTVYNEANGLPNQRANALAVGPDGTLWVGTSGGLAQFKNNQWQFYASKDVSGLSDIRRLVFASDGTLWVGTSSIGGGNLCRFDPGSGTCAALHRDTEGIYGLALHPYNESPVYVNNTGLHALVGEQQVDFNVEGNLPATNFVDSFALAPDGMLWVGTDGGIHTLNPAAPDLSWETFTREDGVGGSSSWASGIAIAPDGTVWAAIINGDASRYRDGQWTTVEGLRSYDHVAVDAQGRAWFGDDSKGIIVLNADGSKAMDLTKAQGLPSDSVQALLADGDTMWIALDMGLAKYASGKAELVLDKATLPHPYLRTLALEPSGALLIGGSLSIVRYDGANAEVLYNFQKEGFGDWLNLLAVDLNGRIYAGTQNGLFSSDDGKAWTRLTTADGLLSNYIAALCVDQFGAVWIGSGSSNAGGGLLHIVP